MFDRRRRFHDILDELDRIVDDLEKDVEKTLKGIYESDLKVSKNPLVYGFSMKIGPDGEPALRTFGQKELFDEGFREPIYDQFVNEAKRELKIVVELPGTKKEDIELRAFENEVMVSAIQDERKYKAKIQLKAPIEPSSASARCQNGILEVTFKIKDKTNKGYTNIKID